jgi:ABC-type oligopeptide transport system substrate-binding subunit/ABC-type branched-subunit amino acid transport system substrate-binding protein
MIKKYIIILLCILFVGACKKDTVSERVQRINTSTDIHIAIIDSSNTPSRFVDGVKMAIQELNDSGITGKPIKAIYYDDQGSLAKAQKIAWKIADNPDIIAAVGHFSSTIALSVSITYENNGIIFITPTATITDLIRDNNTYTFRNIPSDKIMGLEMARFASRKKLKRIAIIYERESPGKRLAEIFQKDGDQLGMKFPSVKSYSPWTMDFRPLISDLRNVSFDALLICGNLPTSAYIIKQIRNMGIHVPIIGSDAMDSMQLLNIAGKAAEGVNIPTVFDPKIPHTVTRYFVENFEYFYGFEPDTLSAQGYDAIKVLGHAIEKGGASNPIVISTNLKFLKNWHGVTGSYSFTQRGDIIDKSIFFKSVVNDKFVFAERVLDKKTEIVAPVKDMALRLPVDQISTIDPIHISNPVSIEIVEQLFSGLTDIHPETGVPVPELATHWQSSQNCKKWIFYLRKDALWTDGSPVTAYNIQKTIQRNLTTSSKSGNAHLLYIINHADEISEGKHKDFSKLGIKVSDPYQIEFELNQSAAYFPKIAGLWMFRPLPMKAINEYGNLWTEPSNIQTSGPYALHTWDKGTQMILHKNKRYYDSDSVSIPEIHCYVIADPVLSLSMYYNQELDMIGGHFSRIPEKNIGTISQNPYLLRHYLESPVQCSNAFIFNLKKSPVDNILIRKAIAFASDRHLLLQSLESAPVKILETFTPGSIYHLKTIPTHKNVFNPRKAEQSLSEAGYHNGINFPKISVAYVKTPLTQQLTLSFKRILKYYLNIAVDLHPLKNEDDINIFEQCEIRLVRKCAEYPDPSCWLNSLQTYGIMHSKFTRLLDKASQTSQMEQRKQLYLAAERFVIDDLCAIIPIYQEKERILVHPRISGWYHMAFGGQHMCHWCLADD